MKKNRIKMNEGLSDLAHHVDKDHEIQMARSDLYKIAEYAIKLHDMLKGVDDADLMAWQSAKITKASDYLSSVFHNLDYELNVDGRSLADTMGSEFADLGGMEDMDDFDDGDMIPMKKSPSFESKKSRPDYLDLDDDGDTEESMKKAAQDKKKKVKEAKSKRKTKDPCWKGYEQVGMKTKNGKKVPNCVPVKEDVYKRKLSNILERKLNKLSDTLL